MPVSFVVGLDKVSGLVGLLTFTIDVIAFEFNSHHDVIMSLSRNDG